MRLSELTQAILVAVIVAVAAAGALFVFDQQRECEKRGLVAVRAAGWGYVCVKEG